MIGSSWCRRLRSQTDNLPRHRFHHWAVITFQCLSEMVLRGCHRKSSHPAAPEQLDELAMIVNVIVASIIVYDIANTRGLDGDRMSLG